MTGAELFQFLRNEHPLVPVILITTNSDTPAIIRIGPSDFLIRPVEPEQLRAAIVRAVNEEEFNEAKLDRGFDLLTDREYEVLERVIAGESSREIAEKCGISSKTVEAHRARIMDKTRADDLAHLIRMWRAWNKLKVKA